MSLQKNTLAGLKWTILERAGIQGISFATKIILANLLMPEEFGIVATVGIIILLATAFTDGGMGSAIVQGKDIDRTDLSTVFFLNLTISTLLFTGLFAASPYVANFYETPLLRYVLPALAFGVVISSVGQTQMYMLQKQMEFKRLLKISLPATLIGGVVGISMAFTGFGVWALVGQRLVSRGVQTSCVWKFCNVEWRPRFEFSWTSVQKLWKFSASILFVKILYQTSTNMQGLIIGKAFSMEDLGFFNRARTFQKQPTMALTSSLMRVLFPTFAKIQDDDERLNKALRKGIPLLSFFVAPIMIWLICVAEPLILCLIGEKWLPSVPYLQLVPLLGITYSISAVKVNIFQAKGLSRLVVLSAIAKQTLQLGVLWFTWRHGIEAMIIGQISCSVFNMFLNDFLISRKTGLSIPKQIYDWVPYVIVALIAFFVAQLIRAMNLNLAITLLVIQTIAFVGIYLCLCKLFRMQGIEFILSKLVAKK